MPLAAFTHGAGTEGMQLNAVWGDPASAEPVIPAVLKPLVYANRTAVVHNFAEAEALGESVAAQLRAGGAIWASNESLVPAPGG